MTLWLFFKLEAAPRPRPRRRPEFQTPHGVRTSNAQARRAHGPDPRLRGGTRLATGALAVSPLIPTKVGIHRAEGEPCPALRLQACATQHTRSRTSGCLYPEPVEALGNERLPRRCRANLAGSALRQKNQTAQTPAHSRRDRLAHPKRRTLLTSPAIGRMRSTACISGSTSQCMSRALECSSRSCA